MVRHKKARSPLVLRHERGTERTCDNELCDLRAEPGVNRSVLYFVYFKIKSVSLIISAGRPEHV